jgi:hypothetical protein
LTSSSAAVISEADPYDDVDAGDELDVLAAITAARLAVVLTDLAAAAGGIARSTASLAASADCGAGTARPERAHQVPMAALSAALGITVSAPPASTPGGRNASSAQAWRQARSKVFPDGSMTGSAMSAPEIGHRNSSGTASAAHASDRAGEAGPGAAANDLDEGEHGALPPPPPPAALMERWNGSFQRRGRAAPMDRCVQ